MLTVDQLRCSRGDRMLFRGLSFAVSPGQVLAITGSNGSGKTTLLRTICRLAPVDGGTISWQGRDIGTIADHYLAQLLYIGHRNALKDDLTPGENLVALARLGGAEPEPGTLLDSLDAVGLGRAVSRLPVRVLSEGQKRRVALARLWCEPRPLWILDEPFTALDASSVQILRQRMQRHLDAGGLILTATHEPVGLSAHAMREIRLA
ncbi:MAG: cytochrome c biogenesis heme-transporting ATPase CcmA [Nitrospira sp.]